MIPRPPLWRNRNLAKLLLAGIASTGGGSIAFVCLLWLVYASSGSALDVAYVGVVSTIVAVLVSLPAGAWSDRYDRRRLMILADLTRAVTVGAIGLLFLLLGFQLLEALLLIAVLTAATLPFDFAERSVLVVVVEPDRIADANGAVHTAKQSMGFVGNAVAGVLVIAVGAVAGLLLNALTYLISAALVALVLIRPSGRPDAAVDAPKPPAKGYVSETVEGFRWLRNSPGLLALTLSALFMNFFQSMSGPFMVVYAAAALHGSALTFGLLGGLLALGDIVGSLLVGRSRGSERAGQAWLVGYGGVTGAAFVVLALFPATVPALILCFLAGVGSGYGGTAWLTASQVLVPLEMQGRYFGIDALGSTGILPIGILLGGVLIGAHGVELTFLVSGAGLALSALCFATYRPLWRLRASRKVEGAGLTPIPSAGGATNAPPLNSR